MSKMKKMHDKGNKKVITFFSLLELVYFLAHHIYSNYCSCILKNRVESMY
jgi:hypothetical protein